MFLKPKKVKVYREWDEFKSVDWISVNTSNTPVWVSVRDSVWASVRASVKDSVLDLDSVWVFVRSFVLDSVWDSIGAWYWADDLATANVFADVGLLPKEKIKELEGWKRILETQRLGVLTKDIAIAYILPAPIIRRNSRGFLHSDTNPAVQWGKSGLYFLNGVYFPKELWKRVVSRKMSFKKILQIKNIDQRVQAMKYGDLEAFLKETKAKLLDRSKKGNELYLIPQTAGIFSTDAYFLKYKDPSTDRVYISGIDPEIGKRKSADEAMAWKHYFTLEEYYKLVET